MNRHFHINIETSRQARTVICVIVCFAFGYLFGWLYNRSNPEHWKTDGHGIAICTGQTPEPINPCLNSAMVTTTVEVNQK